MAVRSAGERHTVVIANPSADLYGSDRMLLEAARGLVGLGWRVVVTCSQVGPLVDALHDVGVEVRLLPVPVVRKSMRNVKGLATLVSRTLAALPRMRRLLRDTGTSVLLVNTLTVPAWLVAARLAGCRVVVHVHEAEASVGHAARLALSLPLVLADQVIFNSEVSRSVSGLRLLERRGRVTVLHNGVSGPPNRRSARATLDPPIRILYVGRLSPRKGVDLVVRAVADLRAQGRAVAVDIVGAVFPGYEWYEAELRTLVDDLGMSGSVTWHGFQNSVWPFFARCDAVVVPSRLDESFGNVLVEALLAERPVVASNHTGLAEAAARFSAVALVPPDSVPDLVNAIEAICDDWGRWRSAAVNDAEIARQRLSPEGFHHALAAKLEGMVTNVRRPSTSG